jgi:predicted short-subunit dehydrogenase-like oxidoreductase (DUF2520 family)
LTKVNIASKLQIIGSEKKNIVILGAGNVATHLSRHLHAQGHIIDCVWSRTEESARKLAESVNAPTVSTFRDLPREADFYLLAVPDDVIAKVAKEASDCQGIWLHTAGSLPMDVFEGLYAEYGVLYPIQTLSRERPVRLGNIPFLVEGSSPEVAEKVHKLALSISGRVQMADSNSRLSIHLAAVFANNFPTYLVHIAEQILKEKNLPVSMLDPLLEETFHKIDSMGAKDAQTGPAVRNDQLTMKRHRELLKNHPEWEKLYTFISREIDRSREE